MLRRFAPAFRPSPHLLLGLACARVRVGKVWVGVVGHVEALILLCTHVLLPRPSPVLLLSSPPLNVPDIDDLARLSVPRRDARDVLAHFLVNPLEVLILVPVA